MTPWRERSPEERSLLNPSFSSVLLWRAVVAYLAESGNGLPFDLTFLVLPLVLHRPTREALPSRMSTSLHVWLGENPLLLARLPERARSLVPYTKATLMFAGRRGLLSITGDSISASTGWKRKISTGLKGSSDEVRLCAKKAEFLGRWFARAGSGTTVMALMGVRA